MSVRRVQKAGADTNGGIGARLAAVLSIGGNKDEQNKRQKTSKFEYGAEYVGTVRGEPVPDTSDSPVPNIFEPTMQYYVEMDKVDSMPELNKFYFNNEVVCHGYRSMSGFTYKATYNGSEYHFIDGRVSNWSGPGEDPVFGVGTRVLFKPIPVSDFIAMDKWNGQQLSGTIYTIPGDNAATMIIVYRGAAASSHTTVRAEDEDEDEDEKSAQQEVEDRLRAIKRYYDEGLITLEDFEKKKSDLGGLECF